VVKMADALPWLTLAGIGAFHGLNPGMGWLFAVALGLHRRDGRIVWLSPIPIALGHALSIALSAAAFVGGSVVVDPGIVRSAAGLLLVGWAIYHWRYGHRHRIRFGMQVGLAGLAAWSFVMATAHGAGLMLWPALIQLCIPAGSDAVVQNPLQIALVGIGLHTLTMLVVTTTVAVAIYQWFELDILKQAWLNVDLLWTVALVVAGSLLLLN
jgi:hypothetical protein